MGTSDAQASFPTLNVRQHRHQLPLPVKPLPDELFSSWVTRTAFANGMLVNQLSSILCGKGRQLFLGDPDRGVWKQPGLALAELTEASKATVEGTYLSAYDGYLWPDRPDHGVWRHVLPLSNANRSRLKYGLQYCPQCLMEDSDPFYRRHWRLTFSVACDWHCCWLRDRCPSCSSSIAPYRVGVSGGRNGVELNNRLCAFCGESLTHTEPQPPPAPELINFQRLVLATLERGWISIAGKCVHSILFFEGLRILESFLEDERHSGRLLRVMGVNSSIDFRVGHRYGGIERCSLVRRAYLLGLVAQLMKGWPLKAMNMLLEARTSSHHLTCFSRQAPVATPFWLWEPVKMHLDKTMYVPSDGEIENALAHLIHQGRTPMLKELCALLNMSTSCNQRLAATLRKSK